VYGVENVLEDCMEFINEKKIQAFSGVDVLMAYYDNLSDLSSRSYAYSMRSPVVESLTVFE
jgi:hypothetical protein